MPHLEDSLLAPHQRDAIVADAVKLIEAHLERRGGLRGMAMKTALGIAKKAVPNLLPRAVNRLLPDFAAALDPLYQEFRESTDRDFSLFLRKQDDRARAALLGAADARIGGVRNELLRKTYASFRGSADEELKQALPQIAKLISGYLL